MHAFLKRKKAFRILTLLSKEHANELIQKSVKKDGDLPVSWEIHHLFRAFF